MLADDERSFAVAQQLWTRLGIAYLRLVPRCTPANRCLPLHRVASAFRVAEFCHFLAARTCQPLLAQLLLAVLVSAEANGILRPPLADPDIRNTAREPFPARWPGPSWSIRRTPIT